MKWKLTTVIVLFSLVLIQGCSKNEIKFQSSENLNSLIWPQQPEKTRIKYAGSFRTAKDLGIKRGFFQWLGDLFTGEGEITLKAPMGILATKNEVIFVADPGVHGVHRFDLVNNNYHLIQLPDEQPMVHPMSLAMGQHGNVYVTDPNTANIYKIAKGANTASLFHTDVKIQQPTGITIDKDTGWMYVVDTAKHHVKVFEASGEFLMSFGGRGNVSGRFNYPTMITLTDKDQLLVTDSLNYRVQSFNVQGEFIKQFGGVGQGAGQHSRPKGVASDKFGVTYVVDSMLGVVQMFNPDGEFLMHFGGAGNQKGQFWLPTNIFVKDNNAIYVADTFNNRVQVFFYVGGKL